MKCLFCDVDMEGREYKDQVFNLCPQCESVWIGSDAMKALTNVDPSESRELKCPSCGMELMLKTVQGVEIDLCPQCHNVWLDKGEMEKLTLIDPASGMTKKLSSIFTKEVLDELDL